MKESMLLYIYVCVCINICIFIQAAACRTCHNLETKLSGWHFLRFSISSHTKTNSRIPALEGDEASMVSLPCLQEVSTMNVLNVKADSREDPWEVMVCKNYDGTIVINDSKECCLWRNIRLEVISWGFTVNKVTDIRGHFATFWATVCTNWGTIQLIPNPSDFHPLHYHTFH